MRGLQREMVECCVRVSLAGYSEKDGVLDVVCLGGDEGWCRGSGRADR